MEEWEGKLDPSNYTIGEEVEVYPPAGRPWKAKIEKFEWNEERNVHYCHIATECSEARDESRIYRTSYPFVDRYFRANKRTLESEGKEIVNQLPWTD